MASRSYSKSRHQSPTPTPSGQTGTDASSGKEDSPSSTQHKPIKLEAKDKPQLTFTAFAWMKLTLLCETADYEIGGFGITETDDPFLVTDFVMIKQYNQTAHVEFDDDALASYPIDMYDSGLDIHQCRRIWIHTHPNIGASPSGTDDNTFRDHFDGCDWSVMFIMAKGGNTSALLRLRVNDGLDNSRPIWMDVPMDVRRYTSVTQHDKPFAGLDTCVDLIDEHCNEIVHTVVSSSNTWTTHGRIGFHSPLAQFDSMYSRPKHATMDAWRSWLHDMITERDKNWTRHFESEIDTLTTYDDSEAKIMALWIVEADELWESGSDIHTMTHECFDSDRNKWDNNKIRKLFCHDNAEAQAFATIARNQYRPWISDLVFLIMCCDTEESINEDPNQENASDNNDDTSIELTSDDIARLGGTDDSWFC